jgi:hypothetical protein
MNPTPLQISPVPQSLEDIVREEAYFEWLNGGSSIGHDWAHWFAAENRVLAGIGALPAEPTATSTAPLASASQANLGSHDMGMNVIANEAPQRVRGDKTRNGRAVITEPQTREVKDRRAPRDRPNDRNALPSARK